MSEIREYLLTEVKTFIERAQKLEGVHRIALVGSLTTDKPNPKDADVLVTIDNSVDIDRLAALGRRLKGRGQNKNSGADIFLCSPEGKYLGRTCSYRDCHPRMACEGRQCNSAPRINNDFHLVKLKESLIKKPPIELWPKIITRIEAPKDVREILLTDREPAY